MRKTILAVFLFLILTGCSMGGEYKEPIAKKIGEEFICQEFKEYSITVNSYKFKTGSIDSYQKIPDGEEWVGIIVTVKNKGEDEMQFSENSFNLINSNGEIIKPDAFTYDVWGIERLNNVTLSTGGTKTGYIAFSNSNTDNSNLKLEFVCDRNSFISTDDTRYEIPLN